MNRYVFATSAAAAVLAAVLADTGLRAQNAASAQAFEVASVKPNKTGDQRVMLGMAPGGRFSASNVPLRLLVRQAYDVQDSQIVGGPDWIGSDRFDVVAKAPDGELAGDSLRPMLRALLADRFKLVAHRETREMPIYALVKARGDGKLGPKLSPSTTNCAEVARARRGGPPPAPPQPGQKLDCGFMIGFGRMNAGGMPITELARTLSNQVGRIVIDKTELSGPYDFELTYAPEQLAGGSGAPPLLNGGPPPNFDPNAPTLFTALQEQLGLKLEGQRGSVDVLVIDKIDQPTPD